MHGLGNFSWQKLSFRSQVSLAQKRGIFSFLVLPRVRMLQFFFIFSEFCGMVQVDIAQSCYFDLTFFSPFVFDLRNYYFVLFTCFYFAWLGWVWEILHNSFFVDCFCDICENLPIDRVICLFFSLKLTISGHSMTSSMVNPLYCQLRQGFNSSIFATGICRFCM